uniref:CARD domain-containing protein n=1 Tax=Pundamilia nyererei TaxID=303518 RepID=A0A3B4F4I3_9CICH
NHEMPGRFFSTVSKFVDKNRATLIKEVSEVLAIAEELGDLVHPEAYSNIRATPTSGDKMRELFEGPLRSGGWRVKAAFFNALKKHHPELVERLVNDTGFLDRLSSLSCY